MQLQRPQIIVRTAAVLTALLSLWALAVLGFGAYRAVAGPHAIRYRDLLGCGLFAIVPIMFAWASVCAWRFAPKGIVSIYSGWLLFGFMAAFVSLFHFFEDWRLEDGFSSLVSICAFLVGVLVARQKRFFQTHAAEQGNK